MQEGELVMTVKLEFFKLKKFITTILTYMARQITAYSTKTEEKLVTATPDKSEFTRAL